MPSGELVSTDRYIEDTVLRLIGGLNPLSAWKEARAPFDVRVDALTWARTRGPQIVCETTAGTLAPASRPLGWSPGRRWYERPSIDGALDDALQRVRTTGNVPLRGSARFAVRKAAIARLLEELPAVVEGLVAPRLKHKLTADQRRRLVEDAEGGQV